MLPEDPGVASETGSVLTLADGHLSRGGISVVEASQSWRHLSRGGISVVEAVHA